MLNIYDGDSRKAYMAGRMAMVRDLHGTGCPCCISSTRVRRLIAACRDKDDREGRAFFLGYARALGEYDGTKVQRFVRFDASAPWRLPA